jgi:hypothetical protein
LKLRWEEKEGKVGDVLLLWIEWEGQDEVDLEEGRRVVKMKRVE